MRKSDFPAGTPHLDAILAGAPDLLTNGGSCVAGPEGQWLIEPTAGDETLLVATISHRQVRMERQNFDPAGHYARPDVMKLMLHRDRQGALETTG